MNRPNAAYPDPSIPQKTHRRQQLLIRPAAAAAATAAAEAAVLVPAPPQDKGTELQIEIRAVRVCLQQQCWGERDKCPCPLLDSTPDMID